MRLIEVGVFFFFLVVKRLREDLLTVCSCLGIKLFLCALWSRAGSIETRLPLEHFLTAAQSRPVRTSSVSRLGKQKIEAMNIGSLGSNVRDNCRGRQITQPHRYVKGREISAVIGIPPPGGVCRVELFGGRYNGEQCVTAS